MQKKKPGKDEKLFSILFTEKIGIKNSKKYCRRKIIFHLKGIRNKKLLYWSVVLE